MVGGRKGRRKIGCGHHRSRAVDAVAVDDRAGGDGHLANFDLTLHARRVGGHDVQARPTLELIGAFEAATKLVELDALLGRAARTDRNACALGDDASLIRTRVVEGKGWSKRGET